MSKLAKKAKRQVSAKRYTNISDLKKKEKKKKEIQVRDKLKHGEEEKQEVKVT